MIKPLNRLFYSVVALVVGVLGASAMSAEPRAVPEYAVASLTQQGLNARYVDTMTGAIVQRIDPTVNFNWAGGSPSPAILADKFKAEWHGFLRAPISGTYTVGTYSDDGVRVVIGDQTYINNWTDHAVKLDKTPILLSGGKTYPISVYYYENGGSAEMRLVWTPPSGNGLVPIPSDCLWAASSRATGLLRTAYASVNFLEESGRHLDGTIDISNIQTLANGGDAIPQSVQWKGFLLPDVEGTKTITLRGAGPGQLTVGGITENLHLVEGSGIYEAGVQLALVAGQRYSITVSCAAIAQPTGSISLQWAAPEQSAVVIPSSQLAPAAWDGRGNGVLGQYYSSVDLTNKCLERVDSGIRFQWGSGRPDPSVPTDKFSCYWSGKLIPKFTEVTKLVSISDDGIIVRLNGRTLIDNWTDHSAKEDAIYCSLIAGSEYDLEVFYYENTGQATARLAWESESLAREDIPASSFTSGVPSNLPLHLLLDNNYSYENPAWVPGLGGGDRARMAATVSRGPCALRADSPGEWYLTNAPSTQSPGVVLSKDGPCEIFVINAQGETQRESLHWRAIDLSDLEYGLGSLTIRKGSFLLFSQSTVLSGSQSLRQRLSGVDTIRNFDSDGLASVEFTQAGQHTVSLLVDAVVRGKLEVHVIEAKFTVQPACEIGYERKYVPLIPYAGDSKGPGISFDSDMPHQCLVGGVCTPQRTEMTIRPMGYGAAKARIRLDGRGAIIAESDIDEFKLTTTAYTGVELIERYTDGTSLVRAQLSLTPQVPAIDIKLYIFISGLTFLDSQITNWVSSSQLVPESPGAGGLGTGNYEYFLIGSPNSSLHFCHSLTAYQLGVQVSR